MSSHEFVRPITDEMAQRRELSGIDSFEPDTTLVAGTRKLIAVMFYLLRIPTMPTQEMIDQHIAEVARDYDSNT